MKQYFSKISFKLYVLKRKLKYLFNPGLKEQINKKAEKLLGGKVIETTDVLHGIRPEDLIEKEWPFNKHHYKCTCGKCYK